MIVTPTTNFPQIFHDCHPYHYCLVENTGDTLVRETNPYTCPVGREYYCNVALHGACHTTLDNTCKLCDPGFYRDEDMENTPDSECLVNFERPAYFFELCFDSTIIWRLGAFFVLFYILTF